MLIRPPKKNLETLRSYGNHIIEPGTGELASHLVGKGRMEEPEVIIRHLEEFFAAKEGELVGKKDYDNYRTDV